MCKLADAESEQQQIFLPLASLGEWGVTGRTPGCSSGLLEERCAAVCHRLAISGKGIRLSLSPVLNCFSSLEEDTQIASSENACWATSSLLKKTSLL